MEIKEIKHILLGEQNLLAGAASAVVGKRGGSQEQKSATQGDPAACRAVGTTQGAWDHTWVGVSIPGAV